MTSKDSDSRVFHRREGSESCCTFVGMMFKLPMAGARSDSHRDARRRTGVCAGSDSEGYRGHWHWHGAEQISFRHSGTRSSPTGWRTGAHHDQPGDSRWALAQTIWCWPERIFGFPARAYLLQRLRVDNLGIDARASTKPRSPHLQVSEHGAARSAARGDSQAAMDGTGHHPMMSARKGARRGGYSNHGLGEDRFSRRVRQFCQAMKLNELAFPLLP